MKNCVFLYTALSLHLLSVHPLSLQNTLAPTNALPKASPSSSDTPQIPCCLISLLLSPQLSLLNTSAGMKPKCVHDLQLFHTCLFQIQIAQLDKTIASPALLPPLQEPSSYTSGTTLNDISLPKQHDLCSSMPQAYYIKGSPIEVYPLMRFSSPTKSRSIQTLSS